ncbi:MAG: site-2 protease family protein [Chloroflexota bacterium]
MLFLGGFDPLFILCFMGALVIAVTVHEFAHNYVAYQMGDPTPAELGKLTLNPLAHVWWQGWIIFVLVGFAPLGFAQINPRRMRDPRWGYFFAVAAGPFSNLLLAIVAAIPARLLFGPVLMPFASPAAGSNVVALFLGLMVFQNVLLFMFNLLPLFPIDGWSMVYAVLPSDLAYTWESWRQYSQYILFGIIFLSFVAPQLNVLGTLIFDPVFRIYFTLIGA